MTYSVKEIFYTLQGEGANAGRAAVFCRFAGCNLWSGKEKDRATAVCTFCDTDFVGTDGVGGGKFGDASDLASRVAATWPKRPTASTRPLVVCTGGEPLLQLDATLIDELHDHGFEVAVETNGTIPAPPSVDWVCVSPKAQSQIVQTSGNELKLIFPQHQVDPATFEDLDFDHHFLQPLDGPEAKENEQRAVNYCLEHPQWRLSLQTHKFLGIP